MRDASLLYTTYVTEDGGIPFPARPCDCRGLVPLPRLADLRLDVRFVREAPVLEGSKGFLRLEQLDVRLGDGAPFSYDAITRHAMDAVVVVPHFRRDGVAHVVLVSAVRPPLVRRGEPSAVMWEVPAGLVEPGESFREAALRELFEETGLRAASDALVDLGASMYPAAAMIAEKHVFFHVEIDWSARETPPGDATPLESVQRAAAIPLDEALALCARGEMRDEKTELALRRLREVL